MGWVLTHLLSRGAQRGCAPAQWLSDKGRCTLLLLKLHPSECWSLPCSSQTHHALSRLGLALEASSLTHTTVTVQHCSCETSKSSTFRSDGNPGPSYSAVGWLPAQHLCISQHKSIFAIAHDEAMLDPLRECLSGTKHIEGDRVREATFLSKLADRVNEDTSSVRCRASGENASLRDSRI